MVQKTAFAATVPTPIRESVAGNVMIISDAAAPIGTWIQGAGASAYMAVKAIEKEFSGQRGYPEYIVWWQKAFYFHNPDYWKMVFEYFAAQ